MNRSIAESRTEDKPEDEPLDPAVERVRRKLVRFAVINLLILFGALALVVALLFWRAARPAPESTEMTQAQLALPAGAQAIGHQVTAEGISILAQLPDGSREILLFESATGRLKGQWRLVVAP